MAEIQIASDVLTLVITLIGSLGVSIPIFARFKTKLSQVKIFMEDLEAALEDDKITIPELQRLTLSGRKILGLQK